MLKKFLKNRKGFTLVELMVTVNIVGILAALSTQYGLTYMQRAREKATTDSLRVMRQALSMYNLDNGTYPSSMAIAEETGTIGAVTYSAGAQVPAEGSGYLRRYPLNLIPGEDDSHDGRWIVSFSDADTEFIDKVTFSQRWDGWHYYYKVDGRVAGRLYVPRSDTDHMGALFSTW